MKKIKIMITMLLSILALVLVFSMTACGTTGNLTDNGNGNENGANNQPSAIEDAKEDYENVTTTPATDDTYKAFVEALTNRYSNIATASPLEVVGDGNFTLELQTDISAMFDGIDYTQTGSGSVSGTISIANKVLDMQGTANGKFDIKGYIDGTNLQVYKGTATAEIKEDGSASASYQLEGSEAVTVSDPALIDKINEYFKSSVGSSSVAITSETIETATTIFPEKIEDLKAVLDAYLTLIGIENKSEIYINDGVCRISVGESYIGMAFDTANNWAIKSFSINLKNINLGKIYDAVLENILPLVNNPSIVQMIQMFNLSEGTVNLSMTLARN